MFGQSADLARLAAVSTPLGAATLPDLLRLVAVPVFAWAAYRDVRTRRVPNRTWLPLVALGLALLAWETVQHYPFVGFESRLYLTRVGLSLLFVAPLGYVFWRIGGFGGADAKAMITLAVLFPTYPTYILPLVGLPGLPAVRTAVGVFSLTVLTNTVLLGLVYPILLGARNAAVGRVSPAMFLARVVAVEDLPRLHGRLFEDRAGFTRRGLDLDALRMYLRWRGLALAELRADPETLRDPDSVGETFEPTDGAVAREAAVPDGGAVTAETSRAADDGSSAADPWAAERFLEEIEGTAYGTSPEMLREGLETVCARERVWISPGLPFIVPMFVGLVVALTAGDVLTVILRLVGLV